MQVDIKEDEPQFLKGHTARSGQEMSPIRVVKNPDGSMQRAALTQSALSRERRDLRQQKERNEAEMGHRSAKPWDDPLAHQSDRCALLWPPTYVLVAMISKALIIVITTTTITM
jgi:ATP-dependent RNA helicase DHX8/PRP22